jgi:hypothetical protein
MSAGIRIGLLKKDRSLTKLSLTIFKRLLKTKTAIMNEDASPTYDNPSQGGSVVINFSNHTLKGSLCGIKTENMFATYSRIPNGVLFLAI